jgi:glyoxylase-like metal-dependent hydrolase (beta-lactamase superfamily II)
VSRTSATVPRLRVGAVELTVLSDGMLRIPAERMIGHTPPEIAARYLVPDARGDLWLGLNCVLLRTPELVALIDTGFGDGPLAADPDLVRAGAGLSAGLAAQGVPPESVDLVINTHLHADHAGGNLAWDGETPRPAFPNADYIVQTDELAWAQAEDPRDAILYEAGEVRALAASGQVRTREGDAELASCIHVRRAPGHSPGHQIVVVESGGESVVIAGDLAPLLMHLRHPDHELPGDLDPAAAVRSRRTIVDWAARRSVPLVSYHEPDEPFVQIGDRP